MKQRGYFDKFLTMDSETTGLAFDTFDPSIESDGSGYYQSISWGLIVADTTTLQPIDKLYLEIKYDGQAIWSPKAESVHGMSIEHLEHNGVDTETAVVEISNFILDHFGPGIVPCAGHNVATFDIWFMRRLLSPYGVMFKTGNRFIDTNTIGFGCYNTYNSDVLFELMGVTREQHNALEDAEASLTVLRNTRLLYDTMFEDQG